VTAILCAKATSLSGDDTACPSLQVLLFEVLSVIPSCSSAGQLLPPPLFLPQQLLRESDGDPSLKQLKVVVNTAKLTKTLRDLDDFAPVPLPSFLATPRSSPHPAGKAK